jgi:tetratricopeptide (TPR) repeat protein
VTTAIGRRILQCYDPRRMEHLAGCPRCGQTLAGESACPRCGVIFAKLLPRDPAEAARDSAAATDPAPVAATRAPVPWGLVVGFAGLMIAGVVGLPRLRSGVPSTPEAPAVGQTESSSAVQAAAAELPPPPMVAPPPLESIAIPAAEGPADADGEQFSQLVQRVNSRGSIGATEVRAVEELLARHSGEKPMRNLAAAVLTTAADQERGRRRFTQATAYLDRATVVDADNVRPWVSLMHVALQASDWARAEAAARGALALDPRMADAWQGLGYALVRQDRNPEAAEALRTAAEIQPDSGTQALLQRVLAGMANEKGMTGQQLAHFHVRYDGDAHEAVGREILRALERHYATLTTSLDHQPESTIPVILYSRESYHVAGGSAHSLGHFDLVDGRIRVPIQGFVGLTPDLDNTLIHELTHAFIHDRTRGVAPRFPVHEGLAQYMAGKRIASELTAEQIGWLADGRITGVWGNYFEALSFVEYLVAMRGMGGMNDVLKAMGETGSVDHAFKRVHGNPYQATVQAWRQRLRQQHGS